MGKTIVTVGVTGNQGSSVARVFLNEPGWTVRGITRDPSKPAAKTWTSQGVEVVAGELDDTDSLRKAFQGANVIFGFTDFWQHLANPESHKLAAEQGRTPNEVAYEKEVAQGKAIVDAAAANVATLDRFVLSTCSESRKWSNGTIKWCLHFDAKAEAVNYLKATYPELWEKTSLLQMAYYVTNWRSFSGTPKKQADGSFVVSLPMSGDRKMPIVDPASDAGYFVKALVGLPLGKLPAGTHLIGAGSYISFKQWCEIFSKVNNVPCVFERMTDQAYEESMGPVYGLELGDMFRYFDKFGYDGSDPDVVYPWNLGVDVKYTTMEEYMKHEDWSSIL